MSDMTDTIKESRIGEEIFNEGYEKGYSDALKGEVIKVKNLPKLKIWKNGDEITFTNTAVSQLWNKDGDEDELLYEGPIKLIETEKGILKFEEVKENE